MRHAVILLAFGSAVAAGEPEIALTYHQISAERSSQIVAKRPAFAPDTPLEPALILESPLKFAQARLVRTDGSKVPYEREMAHIEITGPQIKPLYIEVADFRTIRIAWATDRTLVITRDIGHIAGIEEIIDVVDRKWLSQWEVTYRY